jgi:hypothetical protein
LFTASNAREAQEGTLAAISICLQAIHMTDSVHTGKQLPEKPHGRPLTASTLRRQHSARSADCLPAQPTRSAHYMYATQVVTPVPHTASVSAKGVHAYSCMLVRISVCDAQRTAPHLHTSRPRTDRPT